MPRNSGRSGLTTDWPMRRRPSERTVFRCALFPPIFDLTWVTLSCAIVNVPLRARARARGGGGVSVTATVFGNGEEDR